MAVEFNKYANNYNLLIGKEASKKAETTIKEETKDCEKQVSNFKGLENETDLLTQNAQNLYGVKIHKYTSSDKSIADETNKILAQLGYNFKVNEQQVASVAKGVKDVVLPGLQLAEDGVTAAHIADPNGPFAELFA